jgi:putative acetyltransferase
MQPTADTDRIVIDQLRSAEDARAFQALNEAWIEQIFTLEDADRAILGDPQSSIVDLGGVVLLARDGADVVGCIGVVPVDGRPGTVEIVKMAVSPDSQGAGIGRRLLAAAIDASRAMGATKATLESNRRLAPAVHLYEALGFQHVDRSAHPPTPYDRADVFMDLQL